MEALSPMAMCTVPMTFSSSRGLPTTRARSLVPMPSYASIDDDNPLRASFHGRHVGLSCRQIAEIARFMYQARVRMPLASFQGHTDIGTRWVCDMSHGALGEHMGDFKAQLGDFLIIGVQGSAHGVLGDARQGCAAGSCATGFPARLGVRQGLAGGDQQDVRLLHEGRHGRGWFLAGGFARDDLHQDGLTSSLATGLPEKAPDF